jgi:hypothetical protein
MRAALNVNLRKSWEESVLTEDMLHQRVGKFVEYDLVATRPGVTDRWRGNVTIEHFLLNFGRRWPLSRTALGGSRGKTVRVQT